MESIGLMPSDTGKFGGKRTGQQMTHYIMIDGPYATAVAELLATGLKITWMQIELQRKEKEASLMCQVPLRYVQQQCVGKGGLMIMCTWLASKKCRKFKP